VQKKIYQDNKRNWDATAEYLPDKDYSLVALKYFLQRQLFFRQALNK
jgi:hypothetical protein